MTRSEGADPVTALQDVLDREERRRAALRRLGFFAVAIAVAASIGAVMLLQRNASALDRSATAEKPSVAIPVTAPTPGTAQALPEVTEPSSSVTSATLPVKTPPTGKPQVAKRAASKPSTQKLSLAIGPSGYEPGVVRASTSTPIELTVGKGEGCASGFLMPSLGVEADNSNGPVTVKLGTVPAGTYQFSCGMEMVTGTLIVQ